MKTIILFMILMAAASSSFAQNCYWVIESNVKTLDHTVVKVYDMTNTLLGEQQINRRLTLASSRDKRMLNRIAEKMYRERQDVLAGKSRRGRAHRSAKV